MKHQTRTLQTRGLTALASIASAIILAQSAQAQSVTWQALETGNASDFTLSTGAQMPTGFAFELGWFTDGFTPVVGNFNLWDANWNTIDGATLSDIGGGFIAVVDVANFSLTPAKQMYIWGSGDQTSPTAEQFLATNAVLADWKTPANVAGQDFSIAPHDPNTTIIVGAVNSVANSFNVEGGGTRTTDTNSYLQSAVITAPIPEPTSILLLAVGGLLGFRRRR